MPGFTFPSVGPLGLGPPPSWPSRCFGRRYYDPLRLPLLRLGSLRLSLDPRNLSLSRFRSSRFPGAGAYPSAPGRFCIPVYLPDISAMRWRSSRAPRLPFCMQPPSRTPVVSSRLAMWSPVLMPSGSVKPSAFPGSHRVILSDRHEFFGAQSRGLHTRCTWLHTHPHGTCMQVRCRFGGSPLLAGLVRLAALTH